MDDEMIEAIEAMGNAFDKNKSNEITARFLDILKVNKCTVLELIYILGITEELHKFMVQEDIKGE